MDQNAEYAALIGNREELYLLLGRLFKLEVDQPLIDKLAVLRFPQDSGNNDLDEGFRTLENYLQHLGPDPINDLAVDYARVFLGAGIYEGVVAYPFESVYTSPEKLIMQEAWVDVVDIFRAHGLDKSSSIDFPEDHIALECEFMAYLCHQIQQTIAEGDWAAINQAIETQKSFLQNHLANWVAGFCDDIQKCSSTDFYKAVGKIALGFITMDLDIIQEISLSTNAFINDINSQIATDTRV